ncbi:MAG: hypothetical protein ACR2JI_15285 [Mycobacterium sp.]
MSAIAAAGMLILGSLGGAAVAAADSPSSTVTVQNGSTVSGVANDGATVDGDGTQGRISGPFIVAKPQITVEASAEQNRP